MSNQNQNQIANDLGAMMQNGPSVFERISKYRDSGTYADEWLIILKILLFISVLFTLAFGATLHYNLALPYAGYWGALAFAGAFTIFLEISKVYTGVLFLRHAFFGMFKHGASSLGLMIAGGAICLGAFMWSYYNSTQGVQYLAYYLGERHVERPVVDLKGKTADVDARLSKTDAFAQKGLGVQWKGIVTRDGQRIARNATAAIAEQERQRTLLLQQGTQEQARLDEHRSTFISKVGILLSFLGGKMEWLQAIMLFGMVWAEKTLWHRMTKTGKIPTYPTGQNGRNQFVPSSPIGFNVDQNGNVRSAVPQRPINGLPQADASVYHTVPHQNGQDDSIGSDAVIKQARTIIQRELANLANENGHPRTISGRINAAIIAQSREVLKPAFSPSPKLATEYYAWMRDTVFPALDGYGRQYAYWKQVLSDLEKFIDADELAAITKA